MTAPARTAARRRAGDLTVIGLAARPGNKHDLIWRIGDGPVRETPDVAIAAANGRVAFAPHRQTVLPPGETVTAADVTELYQAALRALRDGSVICPNDYTPLTADGHCPTCVRLDHGSDF